MIFSVLKTKMKKKKQDSNLKGIKDHIIYLYVRYKW